MWKLYTFSKVLNKFAYCNFLFKTMLNNRKSVMNIPFVFLKKSANSIHKMQAGTSKAISPLNFASQWNPSGHSFKSGNRRCAASFSSPSIQCTQPHFASLLELSSQPTVYLVHFNRTALHSNLVLKLFVFAAERNNIHVCDSILSYDDVSGEDFCLKRLQLNKHWILYLSCF